MKVAEALAQRGDLQKRLNALTDRAKGAARYQEGEEPAESANEMIGQIHRLQREHAILVTRINRTNAVTVLPDGRPMIGALAERDRLAQLRNRLTGIADEAAGVASGRRSWMSRQMRSELKEVTDVRVHELREECDDIAQEYRMLDTLIQQSNWVTDLVE